AMNVQSVVFEYRRDGKPYIPITKSGISMRFSLLLLMFLAVLAFQAQGQPVETDSHSFFYSGSVLRNDRLYFFPTVPIAAGNGMEFRGFGQIYAPQVMHSWFDDVYNEHSNIYMDPDDPYN